MTIPVATGFTTDSPLQARRIGAVVYWRGKVACTAGWKVNVDHAAVPAGAIPMTFRPSSFAHSLSFIQAGGGYMATSSVNADGSLGITPRNAVPSGSTVYYYLSQLSGYIAYDA